MIERSPVARAEPAPDDDGAAFAPGADARPLWSEGDLVISRGSFGSPPVAALALALSGTTPALAAASLFRQYELRHALDPAWAAVPMAWLADAVPPVLVLADPGGQLLAGLSKQGWDRGRFLRVAVSLAQAVSGMHDRGLIHRDIKPANLLVDEARGQAWLCGFSLAMPATEASLSAPADVIAGTWAYMAPEQTGRMNLPIDTRSDLYALGVTLYELLAGALPFVADDPAGWIHCHMARAPTSPEEAKGAPSTVLSDIVLTLLSKNPKERYQSARALESDLRRCLARWVGSGELAHFTLSTRQRGGHLGGHLVASQHLVGRDAELVTLRRAMARAREAGNTELMLVGGYSGSGKSALVGQLQGEARAADVWATGKFDQYKRDIPYLTLAQICDALLARLLALPPGDSARWRARLRQALGDNAGLMIEMSPGFAQLLDGVAPADGAAAQRSPADFYLLFSRFLQLFAGPDAPLILFLDDVQWIDAATLHILESLVVGNDVRHLLLIAAYRDNETSAAHPLQRSLDSLRAIDARVATIVLQPLDVGDLTQFVSLALRAASGLAQPLACLLKSKTDGNPFFVILFLNALIDDGLLSFDPAQRVWEWDLAGIEARQLTDNVVDLIAARLGRLSPGSQRVLGRFACLGHVAAIPILAPALRLSVAATGMALWEALDAGLVRRVDGGYAFLHDRVQEAAYDINPAHRRAAIHLDIGRALYAHFSPEQAEEHIFEIANQFNRGLHLLDGAAERLACTRINLAAGERARRSTAHAASLRYFGAGCSTVDEGVWRYHFALAFELHLRRGEAEFLTGEQDKAEATLAQLAQRADVVDGALVDRAAVAAMQITILTGAGQLDRAIDTCLHYLRQVGVAWTPAPGREEVEQEYAPIRARIADGELEGILALPAMSDAEKKATMDVLVAALPPAFFTNEHLVCRLLCHIVNMSLRWGHTGASALGFAYLGMMLGPYFGDYDAGYRFGQLGYNLVESRRFAAFKARVYMCFAYHVMPWTRHVRDGIALLRRAYEEARESGDLTYGGFASCTLITSLIACGEPLRDVQVEAEAKLELIRRSKFKLVASIIATQVQLVRALRGLTEDVGSFKDGSFSERDVEEASEADASLAIARCWYWIRKLQAHCIAGDAQAALQAAQRAAPLLWTTGGHLELAEFHFYAALTRARCAGTASPPQRTAHLEALAAHADQLALWAASGPANFQCRAELVAAERARLAGDRFDALQHYEAAIGAAQRQGFIYVEALANECAARMCMDQDLPSLTTAFLKNARLAYRAWGAEGKVRQLGAMHAQLRDERPAPQALTIGARLDALDLATMVRTAAVISGEIGLDRLIASLMAIVLEYSGADRAVLILPRENQLWVEGEASIRRDLMDLRRPHVLLADFDLPASLIHQVIRDQAGIVIDNAQVVNPFAADSYFAHSECRSVFCLPLLKQTRIIGLLYLENKLAPRVFTAARQDLLNVMASQAAVSLRNASLEENGALLKEVHHRVKNNLQLISSLLSLQAGRIADPQVADLFHESRNRVRAMALVHENLYRAGNFARVPMADHVDNLCRQIARAYGLSARRIVLVSDIETMQFDLNRAVSCGLLINELITNALKHAFPLEHSGEVRVEMRVRQRHACELTVSDNGAGMQRALDGGDTGSLGLQLVEDLTAQLGGQMTLESGAGTRVTVCFPIDGPGELAGRT